MVTVAVIGGWVAKIGGFAYLLERICAVVGAMLSGSKEVK